MGLMGIGLMGIGHVGIKLMTIGLMVMVLLGTGCRRAQQVVEVTPTVEDHLAFAQDIAPIIQAKCVACHQPDGGAPFSFTSHADVESRARQILEVVESGFMPPWLPDDSVEFAGSLALSNEERARIQAWVEQGAVADDATASFQHRSDAGWVLGLPDLVASMPAPFEVPATDTDIYRNFVIPIPVERSRFVKAVEIRPTNLAVSHHMFVRVDKNRQARKLSGMDGQPGFEGMERPGEIHAPEGCILTWQVGKRPSPEPDGICWKVDPGTDFVVEAHMQPTGKKELFSVQIGLHFSDRPPSRFAVLANLRQLDIDIAPGDDDYRTTMRYTLPVAAEATAVLPHAHYLGRTLEGYAELPDGTKRPLIRIPQWDFNWQGEYRYKEALHLPAGTTLVMDYRFDNSDQNIANPHDPPQRVRYGPKTVDEMSELAIQLVTDSRRDYALLKNDFDRWRVTEELIPYLRRVLSDRERDQTELDLAQLGLAKALFGIGQRAEARQLLVSLTQSSDANAESFALLGRMAVDEGDLAKGWSYFRQALQVEPGQVDALNGMGLVAMRERRYALAVPAFQRILKDYPADVTVLVNLSICQAQLGKLDLALQTAKKAVEIDATNARAQTLVAELEGFVRRRSER